MRTVAKMTKISPNQMMTASVTGIESINGLNALIVRTAKITPAMKERRKGPMTKQKIKPNQVGSKNSHVNSREMKLAVSSENKM